MPPASPYWRRRREFLRTLPLFARSSEAELRAFDRLAGEIWVERGSDLIREGSRGVEFAVIAEGRVVVERAGRRVATLGPGDFVGELALLDDRTRTATVTATSRARLLVLGADGFEAVLRDVPSVRVPVAAAAAARRDGVPVVPASALAAADGAPDGGGRRRARRCVLVVVLACGVAAVAGGGWVMRERHHTTKVELRDALARFRSTPTSAPPMGAVPGAAADPAAAPPAPGVYSYATDGWESISMLGGRHEYPNRSHAVVRHAGGCRWSVEHRIIEEHVDRHGRCTEAGSLGVTFEGREVEFFSKRDGLHYECDGSSPFPLHDGAGTVRRVACRTTAGDTMDLAVRRERPETLTVGGARIDTVHVRAEIVLRGRAAGTSTADFWLHPASGLIVKEHRVVDTRADALFGDVRYREEVALHLESLTPAR